MRITPSDPSVIPGGTIKFAVEALDQHGAVMDPAPGTPGWEVIGEGTITSAGTFTAPSKEVETQVKVSIDGTTATTTVTVSNVPPIYIKINAGGSGVSGWEDDTQYLVAGSEGSPYSFPAAATEGVENAAPAEVYTSVRRENHSYSFPDIEPGQYTVRFHFVDHYEMDRAMDYTVEGTEVISGLNIVEAAGGTGKAYVVDVDVTVDTDGLQIDANRGSGNDVFEAGIEIFNSVNIAPPILVLSPAGGEQLSVGEDLAIRYSADCNEVAGVKIALSIDNGKVWTTIVDESLPCGESQTHTWPIPATVTLSDGSPISTVSEQCLINVSPYLGDQSIADQCDEPFSIAGSASTRMNSAMHAGNASFAVRHLPRSSTLRITIQSKQSHRVMVMGINGTMVRTRSGTTTQTYDLDISSLGAGLYVIEVRGDKETWKRRINIMR